MIDNSPVHIPTKQSHYLHNHHVHDHSKPDPIDIRLRQLDYKNPLTISIDLSIARSTQRKEVQIRR